MKARTLVEVQPYTFLNSAARRGWVDIMPQPIKLQYPCYRRLDGPWDEWTGVENLAPARVKTLNRQAIPR